MLLVQNQYKFVDLFCGAGGMSKGFEQSGKFQSVLGTDHDPLCAGTYIANHPHANFIKANVCYVTGEDICRVAGINNDEIDVVIGGTPCQGFSTLGKRLVDDPRNLLFCEFARIVGEIKPSVFVLENVSGMKSMKDIENNVVYDMVKSSFNNIGYGVNSFLLNAANFGVPQERKRLIFIGCKYDGIEAMSPSITHYIEESGNIGKWSMNLKKALTLIDAIGDLPTINAGEENIEYLAPQNDYQKYMRNYGKTNEVKWLTLHYTFRNSKKLALIIKTIPPGSGKTIWQLMDENPQVVPKEAIPTSGFKNTYGRLSPDKPSTTITRNFTCVSSSRCIHPFQNRSLSPREAARIQSFKDDYIFLSTDIDENLYRKKTAVRQNINTFASFVPDVPERGEIYIYDRRMSFNGKKIKSTAAKRNGINLLIGNAVPPMLAEVISKVVAKMLDEIQSKKQHNQLVLYESSKRNDNLRIRNGQLNLSLDAK